MSAPRTDRTLLLIDLSVGTVLTAALVSLAVRGRTPVSTFYATCLVALYCLFLLGGRQHRRVQAALRASEKRYRKMVETAQEGIWLLDAQLQTTFVNQRITEMVGYSAGEMLGRPLLDFVAHTEHGETKKWLERSSSGSTGQHDFRLRRKDGSDLLVLISIGRMHDDGGNLVGALAMIIDITERKRAGDVLAEERNLLRTLIDNMPDCIFVKDVESRFVLNNLAHLRVLGAATQEEVAGKTDFDVFPEELAVQYHADEQEVVQTGRPLISREEPFIERTTDVSGWLSTTKVPLRDNEGKTVGLVGISRDITEHKRTEEELRRHREHLEERVGERTAELTKANEKLRREIAERERAEEAVARQGELLAAINRVFREALTCETDHEVARTCLNVAEELTDSQFGFIGEVNENGRFDDIALSDPGWDACRIPKTDAARLIKDMEIRGIWGKVIRDEQALIVNDPASHPDSVGTPEGHPPLTCLLGVPLKRGVRTTGVIALANSPSGYSLADQQAVEALAVAFVEALASKRTEQALLQYADELAALNKELEAFSYSVSHDLRAPLRAMDGFSQALLEDHTDQLDAEAKDYLDRIRAASQHMGRLTDDLLNLSRVARGEMEREAVDLSAIAEAIAQGLQQTEPERQVEFVIQKGLAASGDERLLSVGLQHLLENAWKFTGKEARATIEFGATQIEGELAYFVRDGGVGFDMAYSDKLFGAFQRLHSTEEFPGTGIGLATVQRVVHRHGGRVWAEGAVGQGATLYFTL